MTCWNGRPARPILPSAIIRWSTTTWATTQVDRGETERAHLHYAQARRLPLDHSFPFQVEAVAALEAALAAEPNDASAAYTLGSFLCDLDPERAIAAWERASVAEPELALAHRNLALAYANHGGNLASGIERLERALACNSTDPRFYLELDELLERAGLPAEQRLRRLLEHQDVVKGSDDALTHEAELLVFCGRYDEALALMETHHFHNWEGWGKIHEVYVDAHLLRGHQQFTTGHVAAALADYKAALEYPANLEVGRLEPDWRTPQIQYLIGTALAELGDREAACTAYGAAIAVPIAAPVAAWYYQGLAQRALSDPAGADRLFDGLIASGQAQLGRPPVVDFFGKFLGAVPPALQRAESHYISALGHLAQGRRAEAQSAFASALQAYPYHTWARAQLAVLSTPT